MKKDLAIFEGHEIRRLYDEKTETWFFSVVDIIRVLTQQPDYQASRKYWKVLKGRLVKEGSELVTNCYQLKMAAEDGKLRLTDVANASNPSTSKGGSRPSRYYQDIAVERVMEAIEEGYKRILLMLATGTGQDLYRISGRLEAVP